MGFERAIKDLKCVFSSEIDSSAIKTYQSNFGESVVSGDIELIDPYSIPDHDILLAGFPCQPFSQAGRKKGFSDKRGTLFFRIEDILIEKRPLAFLLENVKQLKGHDGGKTLGVIKERLIKAGYVVYDKILRARDFGVPQNRERIYIVGFLNHSSFFNFPEHNILPTTVGQILEDDVPSKYTISDKLWAGHQRRKKENRQKGRGFGYGLVTAESPYTNTLSARYYKDGSEILIEQTNKNPRKITPREAARLQGFPDSFTIPVSDVQAYKQFGNSVCVPVIEAIAKEMFKSLTVLT